MKKAELLVVGIITILLLLIIIQEVIFNGFSNIYHVLLLPWVSALATFISYWLAALICKKVQQPYIWLLLTGLLFFMLHQQLYFPTALYIVFFAMLGIAITRNQIKPVIKKAGSAIGIILFVFLLFSNPLIIKHKNFGVDTNGNLVNATRVWDFTKNTPPTLPDLVFKNTNGNTVNINSFKNKIIYISFGASWCAPCHAEKPALDQLKETFKNNKDVVFIDVSLDTNKQAWLTNIAKEKPTGLQLIVDNEMATRKNFNIYAIPNHSIVNKKGQYKNLRFINAAKKFLENESLLNEWIIAKPKIYNNN